MFPLLDESQFVGAIWDPVEGHLDPSGTTHAYAKAARRSSAPRSSCATASSSSSSEPDGTWNVVTEQGTVQAEHVVNAGGLWAREVGRMVGLELPVLAMEHMYLLTEAMPEVAEFNAPTGREMIARARFRRRDLHCARSAAACCSAPMRRPAGRGRRRSTPWDFGHELLEPDLDRIAPSLEVGFRHFPAFENAGIKQIINGPFTFAPDGNPLVGPVQGLTQFLGRLRASWPASARAAASAWRCRTG